MGLLLQRLPAVGRSELVAQQLNPVLEHIPPGDLSLRKSRGDGDSARSFDCGWSALAEPAAAHGAQRVAQPPQPVASAQQSGLAFMTELPGGGGELAEFAVQSAQSCGKADDVLVSVGRAATEVTDRAQRAFKFTSNVGDPTRSVGHGSGELGGLASRC